MLLSKQSHSRSCVTVTSNSTHAAKLAHYSLQRQEGNIPGLVSPKNTTQNFSEDDEHFALLHHEAEQQTKLPSCSDLSYAENKSLKPWGSPVQSTTDLSVWILLLASTSVSTDGSVPLMLGQGCQKCSNSSSTTTSYYKRDKSSLNVFFCFKK